MLAIWGGVKRPLRTVASMMSSTSPRQSASCSSNTSHMWISAVSAWADSITAVRVLHQEHESHVEFCSLCMG